MRAAVRDRFGAPGAVVELRELEKPAPADDEVLVRVRAASVNIADWYSVTGRPQIARPTMGLFRPKSNRLGVDYAGIVEAVGAGVTQFRAGDEVFGGRDGAFADYVCVREERAIVPKPANVSFEEAAAVPVAALTALQGLRDKGGLEPGHKVLINGASGGVGTFAVPIAKALGAEVTAVCGAQNVEQARSLGADHVVDYTREDFTRSERRYDVLLDIAGTRSFSDCKRVLEPDAVFVVVGGPRKSRFLGPIGHLAGIRVATMRGSRKSVFFIAKFTKQDLETLADLIASGRVTPLVERTYGLEEIADALDHVGERHARSKIVVTI
jgi:NADPH:quinone reductase-like Zn-dependent oxidoreductase